jgi:hypothetical protein
MSTKLVVLFANRVDERRNMINDYLSGRCCIESVTWISVYSLLLEIYSLDGLGCPGVIKVVVDPEKFILHSPL